MVNNDYNKSLLDVFRNGGKLDEKALANYEKELIKVYKNTLNAVRLELAKMYERYGDNVTYSDMVKYNRLAGIEKNISEELRVLNKETNGKITSSIKESFGNSYALTGYANESMLNMNLGFGALNKDAINAAVLNKYDRIKWPDRLSKNTENLNNQIRSAVTEGLIQGHGYSKTSNMVKDKIERDAYNTNRILRTESHRAQGEGRKYGFEKAKEAADKEGIKMVRVWLATLDGRTRDSHQAMDGQYEDENGQFHFPEGGVADGPGMSGIAAEDINCRCDTYTQVEDIPPGKRQDMEDDELIEYKTYQEWAKEKGVELKYNVDAKYISKADV